MQVTNWTYQMHFIQTAKNFPEVLHQQFTANRTVY